MFSTTTDVGCVSTCLATFHISSAFLHSSDISIDSNDGWDRVDTESDEVTCTKTWIISMNHGRRENCPRTIQISIFWPVTFPERFLNPIPGCDRRLLERLTSISRKTSFSGCTLRPSFYVAGNVSTSASITFAGRRCFLIHSVFWLRNNRRLAFESWNEIVWADKGSSAITPACRRTVSFVLFIFTFCSMLTRLISSEQHDMLPYWLNCVSLCVLSRNQTKLSLVPIQSALSYLVSTKGPKNGPYHATQTDYSSSTLRSRGLRTSPKRFDGKLRRYQATTHLTRFPVSKVRLLFDCDGKIPNSPMKSLASEERRSEFVLFVFYWVELWSHESATLTSLSISLTWQVRLKIPFSGLFQVSSRTVDCSRKHVTRREGRLQSPTDWSFVQTNAAGDLKEGHLEYQ